MNEWIKNEEGKKGRKEGKERGREGKKKAALQSSREETNEYSIPLLVVEILMSNTVV